MISKSIISVAAVCALTACGGGGGGGTASFADLSSQLATLNADFAGASFTPEANMNLGVASYAGVANIAFGTGVGPKDAALGALNVSVDFTNDTLSGNINNFQYLDQTAASGSMTITNGNLTGNNAAGIGAGLTADASGTVAGNSVNFDVTGHFAGNAAEAMFLYMDPKASGDPSLGVGVAAKQ